MKLKEILESDVISIPNSGVFQTIYFCTLHNRKKPIKQFLSFDEADSFAQSKNYKIKIYEYDRKSGKVKNVGANYIEEEKEKKEKIIYDHKKLIMEVNKLLSTDSDYQKTNLGYVADYFPKSGLIYLKEFTENQLELLKQNNIREKYFREVEVLKSYKSDIVNKTVKTIKCIFKYEFIKKKEQQNKTDII